MTQRMMTTCLGTVALTSLALTSARRILTERCRVSCRASVLGDKQLTRQRVSRQMTNARRLQL